MSCGSLSAVTTANTSSCYTSVLTIPAVQALNGTNITCTDGTTGAVVGNDIVKITGELSKNVRKSQGYNCLSANFFLLITKAGSNR